MIPDTLAELPVIAIADEAFAENSVVQKITFGMNISSVGLNAFDNCTSLKGVYITSFNANSFHPYVGILDGADNCLFYVPKEVYASNYLVNYFWGPFFEILKSY